MHAWHCSRFINSTVLKSITIEGFDFKIFSVFLFITVLKRKPYTDDIYDCFRKFSGVRKRNFPAQPAQSGSSHSAFSFLWISSSLSATSLSLAARTKPRGVPSFCVCWIIHLRMNITFTTVAWCTLCVWDTEGFASVPGTLLNSARVLMRSLCLMSEAWTEGSSLCSFPRRDDLPTVLGNQACVFSFTSVMSGFFFLSVLSQFKCLWRFFWLHDSASVHDQSFSCFPSDNHTEVRHNPVFTPASVSSTSFFPLFILRDVSDAKPPSHSKRRFPEQLLFICDYINWAFSPACLRCSEFYRKKEWASESDWWRKGERERERGRDAHGEVRLCAPKLHHVGTITLLL